LLRACIHFAIAFGDFVECCLRASRVGFVDGYDSETGLVEVQPRVVSVGEVGHGECEDEAAVHALFFGHACAAARRSATFQGNRVDGNTKSPIHGFRLRPRVSGANELRAHARDCAVKIDRPSRLAESLSKQPGVSWQSSLHLDTCRRCHLSTAAAAVTMRLPRQFNSGATTLELLRIIRASMSPTTPSTGGPNATAPPLAKQTGVCSCLSNVKKPLLRSCSSSARPVSPVAMSSTRPCEQAPRSPSSRETLWR
jgi:hypothetical protein